MTLEQVMLGFLNHHLQGILLYLLEIHPYKITCGIRSREDQQKAFESGHSKVRGDGDYPHMPREDGRSLAVDVWPVVEGKPLDPTLFGKDPWETARWGYFAGCFMTQAKEYFRMVELMNGEHWIGVWGGNWNKDEKILDEKDQRFIDAYHFEIRKM